MTALHPDALDVSASPVLEADSLDAGYGGQPIVRDFSLTVRAGEVTALLGPNGAGKTTLLRTLAGALPKIAGTINYQGAPAPTALHRMARRGVAYVAEEKSVFMDLTALENLRISRGTPERALAIFPELTDHLHRKAGLLSGGQQQILTLARAVSSRPALLLADELSLGLAPQIVHRLLTAVRRAADDGLAVVLVEQHARRALEISDYAIVLQRGAVALRGSRDEVLDRFDEVERSYLAISDTDDGENS
ncbi:MAG: ABC transporter ATP-binding protein [bacterium]|nr:ABC transporter ATP-binding protein [bacterium]